MDESREREIEPVLELQDAVEVNGVKFVPVYLGQKKVKGSDGKTEPHIVHLSQREEQFIQRLLATRSLVEAGEEIGVKLDTAKKWFKRPNIRAVLDQAIAKAAIRAGTDLDESIVWLRNTRDGHIKPNDIQLKSAQTLAKILKPAAAGINVNIQNNVGHFESPYAGLDAAALNAALKERAGAIDVRPESAT